MPRAALVAGDLSRCNAGRKLELLVRTATTNGSSGNGINVDDEIVIVRANALVVAAGLGTARLLHGDVAVGDADTKAAAAAAAATGAVPGLSGWPRRENLPPRSAFRYARGNYFSLSKTSSSPFSRLLYPLPDPRGGLVL